MAHVTGHLDGGIYNVDSTLPAGYNPTSGVGGIPSTLPSTYTEFDPTGLNLPSSSGSNVDPSISSAMGTGGGYFNPSVGGSGGGFDFSGLLGSLLNTGINAYQGQQNLAATENFGAQVMGMAGSLADQSAARGQFKPFTVTSDLATSATTPEGGFGITLSPEQQALQNSLMSQASGAFGEIGVDRASREQQIYDRLQALSNPMAQRAQMELDNSLFGQGRTGLRTDAYGGTPEQLTLSKAIQEQQSADAVKAMNMVTNQRQADFNLGQGLMTSGYVPQQQTLNMLDLGRGVAQIPANLQGNVLSSTANLQSKGLEGYIEAQDQQTAQAIARNKMIADMLQSQGATNQGSVVDSVTGAAVDYVGGLLSSIFS